MVEATPSESKRKRGRSPSYPGIDLGEALDRARMLYEKEGRNAAPVSVILGHWGYKGSTGPGMIALAALVKFGLLVDEGSGAGRKARLSDDALRILLDERGDTFGRLERQQAIQEAALRPAIHAELWGRYGSHLPSDAALRFELQTERAFTKRGVEEFIPQFKSTLAFAKLANGGKLSGNGEDKDEDKREDHLMTLPMTLKDASLPPSSTKREPRVYQIPISQAEAAALQITYPLTAKGWVQMIKVLEAMKPGMIESDGEEATPKDEDKEASE